MEEKNIGEGKYSDGDEEKKNVEGKGGKYLENMNIFFAEKNSIEKRRRKYLQNENCFGRADEKLRRKRRKIFGEGK